MEKSKGNIPEVVAVAGHFNPLHSGHIKMINEASKLARHLVVIVANDDQARNKRPKVFMPVEERAAIVFALKNVSSVFISIDKDSSVCESLKQVKPDIFASGCDENHPDAIVEKKVCDELGIQTVYNVGGFKQNSSSSILKNYQSKVLCFDNEPIKDDLKFLTTSEQPLQIGIHEPKLGRKSKLHFHRVYSEFFLVEKGEITIDLTDEYFNKLETKVIKTGESILIHPGIGHQVTLPAGCRVWEFHQGPYFDDKVILKDDTNL